MLLIVLLSMALVRTFNSVEANIALNNYVANNNSLFFYQCHGALGKIVIIQPYRDTFDIVDTSDKVSIILPFVLF